MEDKNIIAYDSGEAAKKKKLTLNGWVSSKGHYYGNDEHLARWAGCTHRKCRECGELTEKSRLICSKCSDKKDKLKFDSLESKIWDGEGMIYSYHFDRYYSDTDSLLDDCKEIDLHISKSMTVICEPQHLTQIDTDIWEDIFPNDDCGEDYIDADVLTALDELNKAIKESRPISWIPGKYRMDCTYE